MLSAEDNQLLTRTDAGTAMGELFRRFWLPGLLSEEVPAPNCPPVRIRLLGEDLVAFRDSSGRVGVMQAWCPHRGAPLFFGRNEEDGLRCVYHGWKFDVAGNCLDLPNAPEGENYRARVRIAAYPAIDRGGIVWVFMGPPSAVPPLPDYPWFDLPASHRYVRKYFQECNYLQAVEGTIDMSHVRFLHSTLDQNASNPANAISNAAILNSVLPETLGLDETPLGLRWEYKVGQLVGVINIVWPALATVGAAGPGMQSVQPRVPVDDMHSLVFRLRWSEKPIPQDEIAQYRFGTFFPQEVPGTFLMAENRRNDYLIDRIAQKYYSYTGISSIPAQDLAVQENQRGPIMDRTKEHLVSTDDVIIRLRQMMLRMARDLANGREPEAPRHGQLMRNLRAGNCRVPDGADPKATVKALARLDADAPAAA
ncbi:MAG: Rieske 2Fe-2S domain-containing protein [Chloroflexi bacterium]|nr:Rieske 2Fe-2S domain-containing protein [Chloroflexota bacterium]